MYRVQYVDFSYLWYNIHLTSTGFSAFFDLDIKEKAIIIM